MALAYVRFFINKPAKRPDVVQCLMQMTASLLHYQGKYPPPSSALHKEALQSVATSHFLLPRLLLAATPDKRKCEHGSSFLFLGPVHTVHSSCHISVVLRQHPTYGGICSKATLPAWTLDSLAVAQAQLSIDGQKGCKNRPRFPNK